MNQEILDWVQSAWANALEGAVRAMTGEEVSASATDGVPGDTGDSDVLFRQPTDAAPQADIWAVVPREAWSKIGGKVLHSAGLEDVTEDEARGTFLEVLQQSLSPLAQELGARLHREVTFHSGGEELDPVQALDWMGIHLVVAGESLPPLFLAFAPALTAQLTAAVTQSEMQHSSAAARQIAASETPIVRASKTMDLLLEVELPVGVSFGRVQMKLKDAVKLTTGSIIELNRRVAEPVEVIVNNCVIARGEVVVVEGNYGVRIQEIVSREQRLRTLF